jgi:hypothetical protein
MLTTFTKFADKFSLFTWPRTNGVSVFQIREDYSAFVNRKRITKIFTRDTYPDRVFIVTEDKTELSYEREANHWWEMYQLVKVF